MKRLKQVIEWYKDEPWYAIFKDAYMGIKLGFSLGLQLAKEDWALSKKKKSE